MRGDSPIVAVTGASGFIGRNLMVRLEERGLATRSITRETAAEEAHAALAEADIVFHLAGANRPDDPAEFMRVNRDYAAWVARAVAEGGKCPLLVCSSSTRVDDDSDYGRSKHAGEQVMSGLAWRGAAVVALYRLPNVFGKWARPDYNSAVATFCHNLARGLPIRIDDPDAPLSLLYIDDLIDQWCRLIDTPPESSGIIEAECVHHSSVGQVAETIRAFAAGRAEGRVEAVGSGLDRALYATFVSCLPEADFSYGLAAHADQRGSFCEMLKTASCGQFSWFTAHPGMTRGGHYHHSKVEKFVVIRGRARFRFRHIGSGRTHEIEASADAPMVVETIPGWAHDITNIGSEEMISLIWANEIFDRERPDTVAMAL